MPPTTQPQTNTPFNNGQPLSQDQITSMRSQFGIKPTAGNSTPGSDTASQWAKFDQMKSKSSPQASQQNMTQRMGSDIQSAGQNVYNDISGGGNPVVSGFKAASDATTGVMNTASEVLPSPVRQGLGAASNAAGGVVNWLGEKLGNTQLAQDFVTKHPDAAKTLEGMASIGASAGNVAGGVLLAGGTAAAGDAAAGKVADIAPKVGQSVSDAASTIKGKIVGEPASITVGGKTLTLDQIHATDPQTLMKDLSPADQKALSQFDREQSSIQMSKTAKAAGEEIPVEPQKPLPEGSTAKINPSSEDAKNLKNSINALNPDLKGTKLANAYKQAVTGGREATAPSIFKEQGLSPDQQTINLATRLKDLGLGKDPIKNINLLGKALGDTEDKLTTALKGDSEINFNADKPTLITKLEGIKNQLPREYSAIKDSKSVFNNVVSFAKETVGKSEDTISGIRDARTAFDTQAKTEYPSAFKNGTIDPKTPAGRAIKLVRDSINEHLYNTAPNGSEIQGLIGREADIFRATDNIAPKAASGHGQSLPGKILKTIKNHPLVSAASAYGVDKAIKSTTGIGF